MKTTIRNITIKLVIFLIIGVMGMFIVSKTIFMHAHRLNDGTVIVHTHPYNKSDDSKPYKSHHHTNAELLFFQNIEILFLIVFLILALPALIKKIKHLFHLISRNTLSCIILYKGRAPPIL